MPLEETRDVLLICPDDIAHHSLQAGHRVTLLFDADDGVARHLDGLVVTAGRQGYPVRIEAHA